MADLSYYPPNPPNVPDDFAKPSAQYKARKLVVRGALAFFFSFYLGIMLLCGILVLWAILLRPDESWLPRTIAMILIPTASVLGINLFKNLFNYERESNQFLIEIFAEEHPRLFAFIYRVCDDAHAERPVHVYVDYTVNASAISDASSFFHLLKPTGKSLIIGLGLVHCLNLTEFKSVLAHEFGHFTQKGTRTKALIVTAYNMLKKMIYSTDAFDRFVIRYSQRHTLFALLALLPRGILWLPRKVLVTMLYAVAYSVLAHRRQNELHADQIAWGLTGSDAVVHRQYRLRFGNECFRQVIDDLRLAMTHHLYTTDLFYHFAVAAYHLRVLKNDPRLGEPPPLPADPTKTTQVFQDDGDKFSELWSDHPSDYEIERHVKARYIRSAFDERSPWLLFDNAKELRERVTHKFYRFHFKTPKNVLLADPAEVQRFMDAEHADRTRDCQRLAATPKVCGGGVAHACSVAANPIGAAARTD